MKDGGIVLDWHTCDIFPERWIDLVIVLRCDHTILWNRLQERQAPTIDQALCADCLHAKEIIL